jgi:hypothetical protein
MAALGQDIARAALARFAFPKISKLAHDQSLTAPEPMRAPSKCSIWFPPNRRLPTDKGQAKRPSVPSYPGYPCASRIERAHERGCLAAARSSCSASNVVRCIGPLLSDDPQRREWTAEDTGASSNTDNLALERGGGFDDRCTLSHEGP